MLSELFVNAPLTPEQGEALKSMEAELSRSRTQIEQLKNRIETLEAQASQEHTVLTRPEFNREVARMLAFDERYGGTSSVIYIDVSSLDAVSARLGPSVAAEATKVITLMLARHVRRSDIIGRLGVDEFGVLLVRCNNDDAWRKGRALASLLTNALDSIDGKKLGLEISFGAYTFREEEDVATGLKEAAHALTKIEKT